eukprot:1161542-Pelagomonas_calceolata.AAC.4
MSTQVSLEHAAQMDHLRGPIGSHTRSTPGAGHRRSDSPQVYLHRLAVSRSDWRLFVSICNL